MYYQIKDTLTECAAKDIGNRKIPYVANVSLEEFEEKKDLFDMGIDLDLHAEGDDITEIQVNYDSLTGSFAIPDFTSIDSPPHTFLFAIDERGVVIIDDDGTAGAILEKIQTSKRWKLPSIERFMYDFLEGILTGDLIMLERYEKEMDAMEDRIVSGDLSGTMERLVDIRSELWTFGPITNNSSISARSSKRTKTVSSRRRTCASLGCSSNAWSVCSPS